jgi:hypothetical protein
MNRRVSYLIIGKLFFLCLVSVTSASSFSDSRTMTLFGDGNIFDGLQLQPSDVNLTFSTTDSLIYTVMLSEREQSLSMVRSGNLFSLNPQPQPFNAGQFDNGYILSNGDIGAFVLMGQNSYEPLVNSIHVATWVENKPILASQIAGDWGMTWIYDNNLKSNPEEAFSVTTRVLSITDIGDNQVEVQIDSLLNPPWRMYIHGNTLEPVPGTFDPYPSMAHLSMKTNGQSLVLAALGVETWDATDVSADIAFSTRTTYVPAPNEPVDFSESDLAGTWQVHGLISGDSSDRPGWYYCSVTFDTNANPIFTNIVDSMGNSDYVPETRAWAVNKSGEITIPGNPEIQFHGVLCRTKDLIVAVATMSPGRYEDVRGYNLQILQKQPETTCSTSDLAGTWSMHGLFSGDGSAWRGWYHYNGQTDTGGNRTQIPGSYVNSDSQSNDDAGTEPTAVLSDGTVRLPNVSGSHGALSPNKRFIVLTRTGHIPGREGFDLCVCQKRSAVTFRQSDLTGTWFLHGLTSGYEEDSKDWFRGTMEIQADGSYSSKMTNRSEEINTDGGPATLATDGTFAFQTHFSSSPHGTMSENKEVIVFTMDDGGGGYDLCIMTRCNPSASSPN